MRNTLIPRQSLNAICPSVTRVISDCRSISTAFTHCQMKVTPLSAIRKKNSRPVLTRGCSSLPAGIRNMLRRRKIKKIVHLTAVQKRWSIQETGVENSPVCTVAIRYYAVTSANVDWVNIYTLPKCSARCVLVRHGKLYLSLIIHYFRILNDHLSWSLALYKKLKRPLCTLMLSYRFRSLFWNADANDRSTYEKKNKHAKYYDFKTF